MELTEQQLDGIVERIVKRIRESLAPWFQRDQFDPIARDMELRERTIRVEEELKHLREELKHQRELMQQGFESMDKRFASLQWFVGGGFVVITVLITVYNFIG